MEGRAVAAGSRGGRDARCYIRFRPKPAFVGGDDGAADGRPQTQARFLGRVERLKMRSPSGGRTGHLAVSEERVINFKTMSYEPSWLYPGGFQFKKHCFGSKPGELLETTPTGKLKEEFQCAQFLAGLPEVKFWVRNLANKSTSFRLQTSKNWFYPDFLCQLIDGRNLVVEYKGEHLFADAEEKACRRCRVGKPQRRQMPFRHAHRGGFLYHHAKSPLASQQRRPVTTEEIAKVSAAVLGWLTELSVGGSQAFSCASRGCQGLAPVCSPRRSGL